MAAQARNAEVIIIPINRSLRSFLAVSFLSILLVTALLPGITGNDNGVGDGDRDYGSCILCHGTQGSGLVTMEASSDAVIAGLEITVTINVTETQLGNSKKIGVFLLRSLTGDGDQPALDGWTIVRDPNGGEHNYVEKVSSGEGGTVGFNWTLLAPSEPGYYQLYARTKHGGAGPVYESYDEGISVEVKESPLPQFVYHNLPTETIVGQPITINATIKDDEEIVEVVLFYQEVGSEVFQTRPMNLVSGTPKHGEWIADIPPQEITGYVYFDIVANDWENYIQCHEGEHIIEVKISGTPVIDHTPVTTTDLGREIVIRALVTKASTGVTLFYMEVGGGYYDSKVMVPESSSDSMTNFTATIPAQNRSGYLYYYLNATNDTLFSFTEIYELVILTDTDLFPVDILFSDSIHVKEEIIISALIRNNGSEAVEGLRLIFLDDYYDTSHARYIGWVSNLTIPAHTTTEIRAWWTPQTGGLHTLRVVVDSNDWIEETDEGNNELTREVPVGPESQATHHEAGLSWKEALALFAFICMVGIVIIAVMNIERLPMPPWRTRQRKKGE